MTWFEVVRKGLEFIRALLLKLKGTPPKPRITKETVDAQIKRQRELWKKNHPNG
jgi:hypothetical protein